MWATEDESYERWCRETHPADSFGTYYHPGGCHNCGDGPCYLLCENHPGHYSAEREREDTRWNDSLSHDQWYRLAIDEYEREHGEAYVS